MEYALILGTLFWSALAFFGSRQKFLSGEGALYEPLHALKTRLPAALWIVGAAGLCGAAWFTWAEIAAIQRTEGMIGPRFMLAFLCGVAGAVALGAQTSID